MTIVKIQSLSLTGLTGPEQEGEEHTLDMETGEIVLRLSPRYREMLARAPNNGSDLLSTLIHDLGYFFGVDRQGLRIVRSAIERGTYDHG